MKDFQRVILKPGKEKAVRNHHHWIFSGAIQSLPSGFENGSFLPVYTSSEEFLGSGYFNRHSGIRGRMVSFDATEPLVAIEKRLESALAFRKSYFDPSITNAYRLINGDGDGIPGLTVDIYDQVLVFQSATAGIDLIKSWLIDWFMQNIRLKTVYEKSLMSSRKEEGLQEKEGFIKGKEERKILFKENDIHFKADLEKSQKTGFFLDHREMRLWIKELSRNKKVLNAFSYTGGFSLYALAGGSSQVDSIDISKGAIDAINDHIQLNGFDEQRHRGICQDVFEFLRENELNYDIVVLDPPAFVKKQKDLIAGCRGYKDVNRLTIKKMPSKSILLTCSCSHYVDEELFQKIIFQAALEAKREVRIIGKHRLAADHPINIFHPETDYLKSLLLYIE